MNSEKLAILNDACKHFFKNPNCVYKSCPNGISDDALGRWLVVLLKLHDTKTNESRKSEIFDPKHAYYRANKLHVLTIINTDNINNAPTKITHEYVCRFTSKKTQIEYEVGKIVVPDKFESKLDYINFNGIHYFKTLEQAFYFDRKWSPCDDYFRWYENGHKIIEQKIIDLSPNRLTIKDNRFGPFGGNFGETVYVNGKKHGLCKHCIDSPTFATIESIYMDGNKIGLTTTTKLGNEQNAYGETTTIHHKLQQYICTNNNINGACVSWFCYINSSRNNGCRESENGNIQSYQKKINGEKVGLDVQYYPNQQKKSEGLFINGNRIGIFKEYYRDGNPDSLNMYVNDELHGKSINWIYDRNDDSDDDKNNDNDDKKCHIGVRLYTNDEFNGFENRHGDEAVYIDGNVFGVVKTTFNGTIKYELRI